MPDQVLIVEDDVDLADGLRTILELDGYDVALAGNGKEALEVIAAKMPALILLDMMMPIMDGWQFAREFKARYGQAAPIVVVTAAENARERAAEVGAAAFVGKPFEIPQLLESIRRLTASRPRAAAQPDP